MGKISFSNNVKLSFWNIDQLYVNEYDARICKLDNPDVIADLVGDDIVVLAETHCGWNDNPTLPGFAKPHQHIRPKSKNAKKHYGGIAVFVKESIRRGVKFEPQTNSEYMWFKLDKTFFNMLNDLYVVVVYNSNSSFAETNINVLEAVETDAARFSSNGSRLLLCADINGYTACEPDYCVNDSSDIFNSHANDFIPYVEDVPMVRKNMDTKQMDERGSNFIDFLKGSGMRILNGRFLGDTFGNYTCFSHSGSPSVIDYMAASVDLLPDIKTFSVNDLTEFSIHCSLRTVLSTGNFFPDDNASQSYSSTPKFTWSPGDEAKFVSSLNKQNFLSDLDDVCQFSSKSQDEIDFCAEKFTSVMTNAAISAKIRFKPAKLRKNKSKSSIVPKHKPWFDEKCKKLKSELQRLAKLIRRSPFDHSHVYEIRRIRKLYKSCKISAKRSYESNIWNNLNNLEKSNPRKFWKLFSDLKGLNDSQKDNPIPMSDWVEHFSKLLNGAFSPDKNLSSHIEEFIKNNRSKVVDEIDSLISLKEIQDAISVSKKNKAAGLDGLVNEMLKAGASILLPYLHKLFNAIFTSGIFPNSWRTNTLSPLHKKGDTYTTGNYRGIAVSSCVSKLFLSILQKRLSSLSDTKNLIPNCQLGYKKRASTADHILTLKNIIDKYILRASRTYLYACFVDFKSAFDTVWRRALLYKLVKLGVTGRFIDIIENMYSSVFYCVKLSGCISEKIPSNVGVKQGCVLSPLLFNLYLHDLPSIFDSTCDPISLHDIKLSCLMFADDLVILSESAKGLQNALDKLYEYCSKWGLTINTDKTKVLIFNKGGLPISRYKFYLNGSNIDIVQSYCYLGIIFSASGTFSKACEALTNKALKAFYKFKQIHPNNNVPLALKLFDTLVTPIATYSGAIWGPLCTGKNFNVFDLNFYDKAPLEKLNVKLCKYLLGVNKFSVNHAVRGELGRYPMLINVLDMSTKFKKRILSLSNDSLVKKSCLDINESVQDSNLYEPSVKKLCWQARIDSLSNIGVAEQTKLLLQNIYSCLWNDLISNQTCDDKLRTYSKFKQEFELENYIVSVPFSRRRLFTKLRISSHHLAIEKGRHMPLPKRDDIKCDFCTHVKNNCTCNRFKYNRLCHFCCVVEDEKHFMLNCPVYDKERLEFFNNISNIFTFDLSASDDSCFINIMNYFNGDIELAPLVCDFVNTCFDLRKHYFEPFEGNEIIEIFNKTTCTRSGRTSRPPSRLIQSVG